jgi:3-deoxy-7-phosphoheptulonate synthase
MIIVMEKSSLDPQIEYIANQITELGLKAHVIRGTERTVIAAVGDERKIKVESFESFPGVAEVLPILAPYKMASREVRTDHTQIQVLNFKAGNGAVGVMGGPCSVESEEQIVSCARAVKASGATALRGGAYKPRTSPYAFQGMKEDGLKLLALARQETGLAVVTEVMSPEDVELVAKYADILQIGARNMQNYRLLEAAGRSGRAVLLKRGPSATIEEWLLAAEYILNEGNPDVMLCERGIRTFETAARNTLDLNAVPILRRLTHLPVIVDPSHATGKRWMVAPMSYAGVAAGADGIMVEVHPKPEEAWSDGEQSLTLPMFSRLAGELRTIHAVVSPLHANPGEASGR